MAYYFTALESNCSKKKIEPKNARSTKGCHAVANCVKIRILKYSKIFKIPDNEMKIKH